MPPKKKKKSAANGNVIEMKNGGLSDRDRTFSMGSLSSQKEEAVDEDDPRQVWILFVISNDDNI